MNLPKIAVISYHTCPLSDEQDAEVGGMNTYVLELAKAQAAKGYIIDIYTRCVEVNSCFVVEVAPNLRVIHIPAGKPSKLPKEQLLQYVPQFTQNLQQFIRKEKLAYDLISAHYYLSGLAGIQLKRKLKIPLVITFHTLALMKNLVARSNTEKESKLRIQAELELVKAADKVTATSENDFEYIHTLYNCPLSKLALLSPGVNLKLFKPMDKSLAKKQIKANLDHKIILFVGRIIPLKGVDVLLYAIKILIQKNPKLQFCLWIVGEGEVQYLQEIKKLLGITGYVKFVGQIKKEKLPNYYNASEIVIMPSWYESFGIVALEAMACGTPIIVTDVTGVAGLLDKEHNHLLTSAASPISLARKIKTLLTNKSKHQTTSKEVLQKVQNLGWDQVSDKFTCIINNLKT